MSSNNKFGTIIQIGDVLVSEEVVTEYFACDYAVCKGCCCIIGVGALLGLIHDGEIGRVAVGREGFFSIDRDGDIVTPVVDQTEECAYTTFDEDGNCFCSIERCFFQGTCKFRKPQSCWLYPVRVTRLTGGGKALNLHRWGICKDAYEKGRREGIRVYEFLREPLTAVFGEDFYAALSYAATNILASR